MRLLCLLVLMFLVAACGSGNVADDADEGVFTGMDDVTVQENKDLVNGSPWCYTARENGQSLEAVLHFKDYKGGMALRTYRLGGGKSRQAVEFDCPNAGYSVVGSVLTFGCGGNTVSYTFRKAFDGVFKLCQGSGSGDCITVKSADCSL